MESDNLRDVNDFCYVRRGIATGANEFFCLTQSKMLQNNIPVSCVSRCITRSADIINPVFTNEDMDVLIDKDRPVFVLDATEKDEEVLADYIKYGIAHGVHKKYLPANRTPWYSMEQKKVAPIWISSACRGTIKVVRNLAKAHALTTFHSLFVVDEYKDYVDIIFCYFLTPVAQKLLRDNRKELGNGLDKFQPNDINRAKMIDLTLLSLDDKCYVLDIYNQIKTSYEPSLIGQLNNIFTKYI